MTFPPDDEYGDLLRRALRAEADSVVPSPEGLEIIRTRIENRGLRGLRNVMWWRVGASVAGAVLVAGTVVMLVPDLRTQVAESTGISQVGADGNQQPDTSSIQRPPAPGATHQIVVPTTGATHGTQHPTPPPTHRAGASPKPTPSRSDPCATPAPSAGVVEPETTNGPSCAPAQTPPPSSQPPTSTATPSAPASATVTPTPSPSPTASDSVAPDAASTPAS
ncbi:hypothetical protein [Microbispora sp. ATCC PTA-5024]|uniref:hypothetical protein n=1 Tax=Microbispora sp. ATCC PTA-5024 TaxID=316330 RepID=UPI0003DB93ED|nr:hypothetical protein [Microbispora sp. ATCC PTA-5024]ETK35909.1 hypothetical protein MPTA5024_11780 [Microbispora sp. ATCC PTA-5024]